MSRAEVIVLGVLEFFEALKFMNFIDVIEFCFSIGILAVEVSVVCFLVQIAAKAKKGKKITIKGGLLGDVTIEFRECGQWPESDCNSSPKFGAN